MMGESRYRAAVLKAVESSELATSVEAIRKKCGVKSWVTAKAILLELMLEGAIQGRKTTNGWIVWAK